MLFVVFKSPGKMQPLLSCSFLMANTPLGWGWKVKADTSVFAFAMLCSQFVIQDE